MSITISGYDFTSPSSSPNDLQKRSGVYVVLTLNSKSRYVVVDVGESNNVHHRVTGGHERSDCWKRNRLNGLYYSAYYIAGEIQRRNVERAIRQQYKPPCGDR